MARTQALRLLTTQRAFREFFRLESAGGILLMLAAVLAMICANSDLRVFYAHFLETQVTVTVNDFGVAKPLLYWINDGLMAIFFLLVAMEIKREIVGGQLATMNQAILPIVAAIGGVMVPSGIYAYLNWGDPIAVHGWAIPAATDIAFSLGILALLGSRVPLSLKIFLTTLAVIDDLAAIIIIALFYTANLSVNALIFAGIGFLILLAMNLRGVTSRAAYVLVGVAIWLAVLKSGVHATLAGVVLGLLIPHSIKDQNGDSMLNAFEHALHPWVAFAILPLFAFANAGVNLSGITLSTLAEPVPLGIALGLFAGKQIGVMGFSFALIKSGYAKLPEGSNWLSFYAVCILTGIGFTMSLFIGGLAFETRALENYVRLGVLAGSIASAVVGYLLLRYACARIDCPAEDESVRDAVKDTLRFD